MLVAQIAGDTPKGHAPALSGLRSEGVELDQERARDHEVCLKDREVGVCDRADQLGQVLDGLTRSLGQRANEYLDEAVVGRKCARFLAGEATIEGSARDLCAARQGPDRYSRVPSRRDQLCDRRHQALTLLGHDVGARERVGTARKRHG